jgi:large subunit ribosomal protein L33
MAKKNIVLIKLASSEGSGYFFVKKKNPKKLTKKLSFRKYDPKLRKHVLFEEKKLSS